MLRELSTDRFVQAADRGKFDTACPFTERKGQVVLTDTGRQIADQTTIGPPSVISSWAKTRHGVGDRPRVGQIESEQSFRQ